MYPTFLFPWDSSSIPIFVHLQPNKIVLLGHLISFCQSWGSFCLWKIKIFMEYFNDLLYTQIRTAIHSYRPFKVVPFSSQISSFSINDQHLHRKMKGAGLCDTRAYLKFLMLQQVSISWDPSNVSVSLHPDMPARMGGLDYSSDDYEKTWEARYETDYPRDVATKVNTNFMTYNQSINQSIVRLCSFSHWPWLWTKIHKYA